MAKTFSTRALANELGCDPRRLARALDGTDPDFTTRAGGRRWSLQSATRALRAHGHAETGSSASRGNGGGSSDLDRIDALEQASLDLQTALDQLANERNVSRRRDLVKQVGPAWTKFNEMLDESAEALPLHLRELTQAGRDQIRAQIAGAVLGTLRETLNIRLVES